MSQGKDKCGEIWGKMEEKRKQTRQGGERRVQKWKESTEKKNLEKKRKRGCDTTEKRQEGG